ncbi:hypothetical protein ACRCIC_02395, partial [Staphylococcus aureus]
ATSNALIDSLQRGSNIILPALIGVIEYVDKLKKVFNEAFHVNNYDINVTTPVISAHTGQGAIGLVVLKK